MAKRGGSPSKGKKGGANEAKFYESLQDAEARQLETFLRSRSLEIDKEIQQAKLRLKGVNVEISNIAASATPIEGVTGRALHKADMVNIDDVYGAAAMPKKRTQSVERDWEGSDGRAVTERDHKSLLGRLKSAAVDREFSPTTLYETLLPPTLCAPGQDGLPLEEVLDVLQLDLQVAVTNDDQRILVTHYSNASGEIDIPGLLDAMGFLPGQNQIDDLTQTLTGASTAAAAAQALQSPDKHGHAARGGTTNVWDEDNLLTLGGLGDVSLEIAGPADSAAGNGFVRSERNVDSLSKLHSKIAMGDADDADDGTPSYTKNASLRKLQEKAIAMDEIKDIGDGIMMNLDVAASPVAAPRPPSFAAGSGVSVDEIVAQDIDAVGGGDERTSSFLHQAGVDASLHKVRKEYAGSDDVLVGGDGYGSVPAPRDGGLGASQRTAALISQVAHQMTNESIQQAAMHTTGADSDSYSQGVPAGSSELSDRGRSLMLENQRLKKELGAFDVEFFEQLEDLKFR